ncbi:MAG TPA: hypothetical protein DEP00_03550 [Lachnospiraceae bacterium]|nr:hypothetical protein [Lachnospiraceae bacterium]
MKTKGELTMKYNLYADQPWLPMDPNGHANRHLLAFDDGENGYTLNYLKADPKCAANIHKHPHKQFVYILKGSGNFQCGDEFKTLKAGDTVQIDSNVMHGFVSFDENCEWLEFFTPHREDFAPEK